MKHCYQISRSLDMVKCCVKTMNTNLLSETIDTEHCIHNLKLYRDLLAAMNQEIFNDKSPIKFFNPFAH